MSGDIPIVDLSPVGDDTTSQAQSDGLGGVANDMAGASKRARGACEQALGSWEGGSRRALFQHAATGIQAELLALITAAASASDLTDKYTGAQHVTNQQLSSMNSDWTSAQLEVVPAAHPDPSTKAAVISQGHHYAHEAAELKRKLHHLAHTIAGDLDRITNLLVPGGARLSPSAISRKVHDALEGHSLGKNPTPAQISAVLGVARKAAPEKASKENGDLDFNELLRGLNDKVVAGTTLGGEGWAIRNALEYRRTAAASAYKTNVEYAGLAGESLHDVEAAELTKSTPSSILRFAAAEDHIASGESKAAKVAGDLIRGGPYSEATGTALGALGLIGDYTTLQHLDEYRNPTERTAVKYASWLNALGISRSFIGEDLLALNSTDEVPGWGEAVATLTGVFLAGDYVYHEGPNVIRETKDGLVQSLKNWALSTVLHGFG